MILGLDHVMQLRQEALRFGLLVGHPMRPNVINISIGAEDDGDPDSPLRVACRQCAAMGLAPIVAAGNVGPEAGTIMSPAVEPEVLAVGTLNAVPFTPWYFSSHGPTLEGVVKPDIACLGVNVVVASAESDNAYKIKSGTSFSAPMVSGLVALSAEISARLGGEESTETAWLDWITHNVIKPSGYGAGKDNIVGYGMPWGESLAASFSPVVPTQTGSLLPGMAMLAAMSAIMPMLTDSSNKRPARKAVHSAKRR